MTATAPAPVPPGQIGEPSQARGNAYIAILAFSGVIVALMQTLILPIVGKLPQYVGVGADDAAWIVTATLLAASVAVPLMGRLGDMYGKRRVMIVALALLIVGSFICAVSSELIPLVVGRALQGISLGFIPLGISIMRDLLPAGRLAAGTAIMSSSLGIGAAVGLPAAAFIAENFDWHALFWVALALGLVSLALVITWIPESQVRAEGRLDLIGGIGLAIALVCLMLAISKGGAWGWDSGTTVGFFVAGVVVLALWGVYELRHAHPMVDLRTAVKRPVLITNLAGLAFGFASLAVQLIVPQIVQLPESTGFGIGGSLLMAGLVMTPQGIVVMLSAPISARVSNTYGPKATLIAGSGVVVVGYAFGLMLSSELWHLIVMSCIVGAGIGLAYGAMPMLIMGAVPRSETGAANSLNALLRSVGSALASAVSGVVLAQMVFVVGDHRFPTADAFQVIAAIACAAALVALVLAFLLPRQEPGAASAAH